MESYVPPVVDEMDVDDTSKSPTSPKKKKAKKHPNAPKRGASAYLLFSADARPKIKEANPDLDFAATAKKLGEDWKALEDKSEWEEKAKEEKARYEKEMESYVKPETDDMDVDDEKPAKKAKLPKNPDPNVQAATDVEALTFAPVTDPTKTYFTAVSWNVAGLRGTLKKEPKIMADLIEKVKKSGAKQAPDLIMLQETKVSERSER